MHRNLAERICEVAKKFITHTPQQFSLMNRNGPNLPYQQFGASHCTSKNALSGSSNSRQPSRLSSLFYLAEW